MSKNQNTTKALRVSIEGPDLVVRIRMNSTLKPSASGKTLSVASTNGNKETEVEVNGRPVILGLNAYIYPNDR